MTVRRALALAGLLVVLTGGCGKQDGPTADPSTGSSAKVQPEYATGWMQQATVDWDRNKSFASVTQDGRVWTGDPRQYEKVCGATFLIDGTTPDLYGGIRGESAGSNPDPTYYRWLQADPKRWSAFNAWLYDPAIVATLGDTPDTTLGTDRADRIGTTKDCPDAADAGVPAG